MKKHTSVKTLKTTTAKGLRIGDVKAQPPPVQQEGWISVLKAFNPLGPIAQAYAETLAYRIESKRLAIEMQRVARQAEIANNLIDRSFRLKMEELEHRRLAINRYFDTVQGELVSLHMSRMENLNMMHTAQKHSMQPGLSTEERNCAKEMFIALSAAQVGFGQQASASLAELVKALPRVHLPAGLLTDGEDV